MTNESQIEIDGSFGEGGGQILRTSLALSMITGRPLQLDQIRAGRKKPGLMRQHLTCVQAAANVVQAELLGASVGSSRLDFRQTRQPTAGDYHFRIGTAGSTSLVFQTVLPALMILDQPSTVTVEGGTHNKSAPPFEFLSRCFLPQLERMGPTVQLKLERHGFYPAGGGVIKATIDPFNDSSAGDLKLRPTKLDERGKLVSRRVEALVGNLPLHIAQREIKAIQRRLQWPQKSFHSLEVESNGPGNVVIATIEYERVTEVFSGFGEIGVPAERIAKQVAKDIERYITSDVPVGAHLADQLMLPMGICQFLGGGSSSFRTSGLSLHSKTHVELLRKVLGVEVALDEDGGDVMVTC